MRWARQSAKRAEWLLMNREDLNKARRDQRARKKARPAEIVLDGVRLTHEKRP